MAGGTIKDFIKKAKEKREERTKDVSERIEVTKGGKTRTIEFSGTEKTSKSGRRIKTKLSASSVGTIVKKKKILPKGRGTTLTIKKRSIKN